MTFPSNDKQHAICSAIAAHWKEHGYAPTRRELMAMTGISSTSVVSYWLTRLRERGYVLVEAEKARALRLTVAGEEFAA